MHDSRPVRIRLPAIAMIVFGLAAGGARAAAFAPVQSEMTQSETTQSQSVSTAAQSATTQPQSATTPPRAAASGAGGGLAEAAPPPAPSAPAPAPSGPPPAPSGPPPALSGPPPASSGPPPASSEPPTLSVWDLYQRGGIFMYPLTLCSILAVALIIERFVALRRSVVSPTGLLHELRRIAGDLAQDRSAALALCAQNDSALSRMLAAGIKRWPRGPQAVEKAIEDASATEALRLRRNMRFLYSLGAVATLLGLIGTISGMIKAFEVAAASGTGDVHKLSRGIYEAMVNTYGGLAVAIVVTVFYYLLMGVIDRRIADINAQLEAFSESFGLLDEPADRAQFIRE